MLALRGLHCPAGGLATSLSEVALETAIGLAAALVVGSALTLLMRRRQAVRRAALDMLSQMSELPVAERAVAQARLLRRLVLTLSGETAARKQGSAWLEQLDRSFGTDFFTRGRGRYYVEGLYRETQIADVTVLDRELETLFRRIGR